MRIAIINGPNLNLLGQREPEVYGAQGFEEYFEELLLTFPDHELAHFQSNVEGELIDMIQDCKDSCDGVILNAAGYTHTSVAISDAIAAISTPVIEVHISNVFAREAYRRESKIAEKCVGAITGFGLDSYRLAILHLIK